MPTIANPEVFEDWKTTKKDQVKWAREANEHHWSRDQKSRNEKKEFRNWVTRTFGKDWFYFIFNIGSI